MSRPIKLKSNSFILGGLLLVLACGNDINTSGGTPNSQLTITNGRFDVNMIMRDPNSPEINSGDKLGSGALSFSFSGDITGTYSSNGTFVDGQSDDAGVGAILTKIENDDLDKLDEAFSVLSFRPTNNGKADIFLFGNKFDAPVDSLAPGLFYAVGPSAPFNALFLIGVDIQQFWNAETNLIETADNAFVLTAGDIFIATRDSSRITGTFSGTTHITQN